ncbi:hypothetical protein CLUG_00610 [Clavispora lusitaniae ATCC 42720]|uniref:Tetrapyrrole biosynthesis uroporphyrinogen III synthase domain-containing protein n=1 Tax=Clavispora lusitaniae (strain ATCC 42720) TaxID=306902 RepID=C4XXD7_CLAL4|nr:uncharacterized protein CLUG_00610 [Clavispora lusitaniae ATCC 42720]EEQ36487.1 hypothetical protein CLUG_00610 [Clavispora lusitaniae ATCC 42720]KAF5213034.1 hypothetical protein E0198_000549 [Clavispora lusitaniae]
MPCVAECGKRVLFLKNKTTPKDAYEDVFSSSGHKPVFVPLLNHAPIDIDQTAEYLASETFLTETDSFIITSQRAVEVFHECLSVIGSRDPAKVEQIIAKTGYTVGPATEEILRAKGFSDVRGGSLAGNGSKLADIILEEKRGCPKKIVFFTGVIRKDIIPVKLKQEGVDLEEVVIYKTEPKAGILDNFVSCCEEKVDWLVFFSPQGTEEIVEHIQKGKISLDGVRIASIGPTTLEYLNGKGIESHAMAPKPTAAALLEEIMK